MVGVALCNLRHSLLSTEVFRSVFLRVGTLVGTVGAVVGTVVGTVVFTIGAVDLYEMGLTPLNPILHSEQFLL